jgi:hypothetical protein
MRVPVTAVVAVVVVAAVAVPAAALTAGDADRHQQSTIETAPGSRLAGVFGVQGAEIDSSVETEAFAVRLRDARSNASRATAVAGSVEAARERLAEQRRLLDEYRAARQNGSLSAGEYRARVATVAARVRATERLLDRADNASRTLPAAALERGNVTPGAIADLRRSARNLSGPEVAAIARGIAGNGVGGDPAGRPSGVGPPASETGPPAGAGNGPAAPPAPGNRSGGDGPAGGPGASPGGPPADTPAGNDTASQRGAPQGGPGETANRTSPGGPPEERGNGTASNGTANRPDLAVI